MVTCLRGQADHQLGQVALLAQQSVEYERTREATRLVRPELQAPVHRQAEQRRRVPVGTDRRATELVDRQR